MSKIYLKDRQQLEILLAEKGWNYNTLASRVGIGATYLSRIVNGGAIGRRTAKLIANEFRKEVPEIFFITSVDKSFTK